jgi:hypothetical protein
MVKELYNLFSLSASTQRCEVMGDNFLTRRDNAEFTEKMTYSGTHMMCDDRQRC